MEQILDDEGQVCTNMLSIRVRLQKLWADDVLSTVTSTLVRMARVMLHARCLVGENWLDHRHTWQAASAQIAACWGPDFATAVVARLVSAVARLALRPICSVVRRVLHWRCAADVRCLHMLAGRHLGVLGRRRRGWPRRRWKDLCVRAAGVDWSHHLAGKGRLGDIVVGLMGQSPGDRSRGQEQRCSDRRGC